MLECRLDKRFSVFGSLLHHIVGDIGDFVVFRQAAVVPDPSLLRKHVHNALEVIFDADGQGHDEGAGAKNILHLLHHAVEVRANAVKLVHVDDPGYAGFVRIAPVCFRLGFHAAGTAEHADAAIEHL